MKFEEQFPSLKKKKSILDFIRDGLAKCPKAEFIEISRECWDMIRRENLNLSRVPGEPTTIYGLEFEIRDVLGVGLFHLNYEGEEGVHNPLYIIYKKKVNFQKTTKEGFIKGDKKILQIQKQNKELATKNYINILFLKDYEKANDMPKLFTKENIQEQCLSKKKVLEAIAKFKKKVEDQQRSYEKEFTDEDSVVSSYNVMEIFEEIEKELGLK